MFFYENSKLNLHVCQLWQYFHMISAQSSKLNCIQKQSERERERDMMIMDFITFFYSILSFKTESHMLRYILSIIIIVSAQASRYSALCSGAQRLVTATVRK